MSDKLTFDTVCDLAYAIKTDATSTWCSDDGEHSVFTPDKGQRIMLNLIEFWLNHQVT